MTSIPSMVLRNWSGETKAATLTIPCPMVLVTSMPILQMSP